MMLYYGVVHVSKSADKLKFSKFNLSNYRCSQLPASLPSYCRVVTIPGQCCKKLTCDIGGLDQSYKPPSQVVINPRPTDAFGQYITPQSGGSVTNQFIPYVTTTPAASFPGQGFPILSSQFSSVRGKTQTFHCAFHVLIIFLLIYTKSYTLIVNCKIVIDKFT